MISCARPLIYTIHNMYIYVYIYIYRFVHGHFEDQGTYMSISSGSYLGGSFAPQKASSIRTWRYEDLA